MLQRLKTALVFALIVILGIFSGEWGFIALFSAVLVLGLFEYFQMVAPRDQWKDRWRRYSGILWGLVPFGISLYLIHGGQLSGKKLALNILLYLTTLLGWFFVPELFSRRTQRFSQVALGLTGLIYVALPMGCLPLLAYWEGTYQPWQVFSVLLLVWANDTGAYISGIRWGKRFMLPEISPKKTWEGWAGGFLLTLVTGGLLSSGLASWTLKDGLITGVLVAVWGPFGDLVESMLKREFAVKDSGKLLPGHGGVLDRFDAFLFALPPVVLYWYALR